MFLTRLLNNESTMALPSYVILGSFPLNQLMKPLSQYLSPIDIRILNGHSEVQGTSCWRSP